MAHHKMPPRQNDPPPIAFGYAMEMCCNRVGRGFDHDQGTTFFAENKRDCFKAARDYGWKIHKDNTATCPVCRGIREVDCNVR